MTNIHLCVSRSDQLLIQAFFLMTLYFFMKLFTFKLDLRKFQEKKRKETPYLMSLTGLICVFGFSLCVCVFE